MEILDVGILNPKEGSAKLHRNLFGKGNRMLVTIEGAFETVCVGTHRGGNADVLVEGDSHASEVFTTVDITGKLFPCHLCSRIGDVVGDMRRSNRFHLGNAHVIDRRWRIVATATIVAPHENQIIVASGNVLDYVSALPARLLIEFSTSIKRNPACGRDSCVVVGSS